MLHYTAFCPIRYSIERQHPALNTTWSWIIRNA